MAVVKATLGIAVVGSVMACGASAAWGSSAPSTPVGGAVQVWGTPAQNGGGAVVLTGAIADSGKSTNANSSGKPTEKGQGTYRLLILKKGTILLNTTQLSKDLNNNNTPPTTFNTTTCSGTFVVTDPVPIASGTKSYAGISGTVNITVTFAIVLPLTKGTCNTNTNANPIAQYGSIAGTGTVSFS